MKRYGLDSLARAGKLDSANVNSTLTKEAESEGR